MRTLLVVLAVFVLGSSPAGRAAADDPPVFSQAGFDADRAAAIEQDKLHLVYATAVWCPPCQQMKKTTWVDPAVEAWADEHAIVTPLDVDDFPEKAQELRVRAMPTMMLFRVDEEIGRTRGYRSADQLVAWMDGVRTGEIEPGEAEEPAFGGNDANDPAGQRLDEARELYFGERYDEAAEAYATLWDEMLEIDEAYYGVRLSYMVGEMTELADAHPPARERFAQLRDREGKKLRDGDVSWDALTDWVHLNGVIRDHQATFDWVQRIAERPNAAGTLDRFADEITAQAALAGRWDLIALAIPDPTATARESMGMFAMMGDVMGQDPMDSPGMLRYFLRPAVIAALHAGDDGTKERELIEYLETVSGDRQAWRVTFIDAARESGTLRDEHEAWVAEFDLENRYAEDPFGMGEEPEF